MTGVTPSRSASSGSTAVVKYCNKLTHNACGVPGRAIGLPILTRQYSMCYMAEEADLLAALAEVAAQVDRQRAEASAMLRQAVGQAADRGLTQKQIAHAIGRSQPEVSRLIKAYRARKLRPTSHLGKLLIQHRRQILALAQAHHVSHVRVFGSVARGEDDVASDIDLLVDLEPDADLFDLAALDVELEKLLGHPVDIVPARMLKPHVASSALSDAVDL